MPSEPPRSLNWGVLLGYVLGALVAGVCFWIAAILDRWWLNVVLVLFGYALGWNVGMLLSPKNKTEKEEFVTYGKAITAFLGGFLLAKLDAAFGGDALKGVIADPVAATRLLLFGINFLFGVQCTYIGRRYRMWITE